MDFDPSDYIEGAPCADCQLDEPPGEWMRLDEAMALYNERRDRHITRLYHKQYSDAEIGRAVGMTTDGVNRVRRRLGLPKHGFLGYEKWSDPEKLAQLSRKRMQENNPIKHRWANGRKPSANSRVQGVLSDKSKSTEGN